MLMVFSVVFVIRIMARGLGPQEFGAYMLTRRMISVVTPLSTLMMGVTLVRYMGLTRDRDTHHSYLLSGFALGLPISLIIFLVGVLNRNRLAALLYHSQTYASLFVTTLFMIVGVSLFTIMCAFYRGQRKMGVYNLWNLGVNVVGAPIVVLLYAGYGRADTVVLLLGVLCYLSLIPLSFHTVEAFSRRKQNRDTKLIWDLKEFLQYGLPRIPGGFAFAGIFAVGPFLAPHFGSMEKAGCLAIGQTVFRVVEGGIAAYGLVALPKVAQLFAEDRNEFLGERIADVTAVAFHLGLFGALHILLWSDQIVTSWLGDQYLAVIPIIRVFLIALIPYLMHVMLRSVINAVEKKAVNTLNLLISLIATFAISLILAKIGLGIMGLVIGTTIGFMILGSLSTLYLWRSYHIKENPFVIGKCLLLNSVLLVFGFLLKHWFDRIFSGTALLCIAFIMECLFLVLYYLALRRWNVRWIRELEKRIIAA